MPQQAGEISIDDVAKILLEKEYNLFQLRREVEALREQNRQLARALASFQEERTTPNTAVKEGPQYPPAPEGAD
jgi:prefoldin subunit 5